MDIDKAIRNSKIFKYINIVACIILTFFACMNAIGGSVFIMLLDTAMAIFYFRLIFDRMEDIETLKEIKRLQEVLDNEMAKTVGDEKE
jgi:Flp pilus assembly protein TadB